METAAGRGSMGIRISTGKQIAMACVVGTAFLQAPQLAGAGEAPSPERLVHRFLQVEIAPDGAFVASVEGDPPVNGTYPALRDLVIRRVRTGADTKISLACGHVPQS